MKKNAKRTADWRITFEKVSVSYKDTQILNDITFSINPGEITALTGKSRCGKTTLVKTLLQMTDYRGKIFIGAKDCTSLPVSFLREHIAFSSGHSELFHTSVYENIKGGKRLSGEEKQRVSLARAFLKNAEIIITHKASTFRIADKVFRLENGMLYS